MDTSQRISTILRQHKVYSKALLDELVTAVSGNKNVFELYEQEIGMLTPMVSEMLGDAADEYPEEWIASAIAEAAKRNARNWSYVSKILENRKNNGGGAIVKGHSHEMTAEEERQLRQSKLIASLRKYGVET